MHVVGIAGALWIEKSVDSPGYVVRFIFDTHSSYLASGILMSRQPLQEGVQIYGLEGKSMLYTIINLIA